VIPARLLAPLALAAMAAGCALPQALQTDREGMPLNQEIEPEGGYKTGRPRGLRAEEAATDPNVVGCVKVEYMVDPDGVPSQVSILRSHPPGYFDAQALKAMERMRFRPRKSTSFSTRTFRFAPTQDRDGTRKGGSVGGVRERGTETAAAAARARHAQREHPAVHRHAVLRSAAGSGHGPAAPAHRTIEGPQKMEWEAVIGLEVHCQLLTKTKIFSGANTAYGAAPNTQADAVTLGLPGVLPVLNGDALQMAVKFGLAVDAQIAERCVFARKHYFYPDLPKGYQISQYELPIVYKGRLTVDLGDGQTKTIGITRAHMEEDAGKSLHENFSGMSGIDLNRAGTPLIEIVSEPEIRSAAEAVAYLKNLHQLVVYLGICDGNMQEGSFRCDANVSVRPKGTEKFGTRTETKNVNSFRYVEKAIEYEIQRQIEVIEGGGKIIQETRLFNPDTGETRSMRVKEDANDYRYFPDPDLLPVVVTAADIERIRAGMPELPEAKKSRFMSQYGLPAYDAGVLTSEKALADYYEAVVKASGGDPKICANWVTSDLLGTLNKLGKDIGESPVSAAMLAGLVQRIADKTISGKIAKEVFEAMVAGEGDADSIIKARGLVQITDEGAIVKAIEEVMARNPQQLADYRAGKDKLLGFFVGQVMKATGGKANPDALNRLLKQKLAG
jgi:aspartyl-tRNA(Asn)/glutamyl-tRNA(Gln) amidotransferase subunit B